MTQTIGSILVLYSWIVVAILLFFLVLIGRFYQMQFRQRSYYQLFSAPLVLFLAGAIWYLFNTRDFVGLPGPDLLFLIGGLVLIGLGYTLYRIMMARK
ncbi:MAG: hypothetical protein JXM73_00770 [Anaerolineae bacterium]|nr:hypothetical protein [Anaerolineae bacterium]